MIIIHSDDVNASLSERFLCMKYTLKILKLAITNVVHIRQVSIVCMVKYEFTTEYNTYVTPKKG